MQELDRVDLKILSALSEDGRLSIAALADRVALSPTACLRRVRKLEDRGVISGYAAVIEPRGLGLKVEAFVQVGIERQSKEATDQFRESIADLPEVKACYVMTGDLDYLLHIYAADLDAYATFVMERLNALPGVREFRSSFVLQTLKYDESLLGPAYRV